MPSILTHLSMLAMACVLSGCFAPPESMVALSEPGAAYDRRLIGAWNSVDVDGDEAIYLQVLPGEAAATLKIIGVATFFDPDATEPVYWLTATAYASRIDGREYYNVRRVAGSGFDYTAEGESPGFIILDATFPDDATLDLCPMYYVGTLARDVPELRGRMVSGRFGRSGKDAEYDEYAVLELSREELVALVRDTPREELFECFPPFHKVSITNSGVWPK